MSRPTYFVTIYVARLDSRPWRPQMKKCISIAKDFSRFPVGRFNSDGPNSGERFRDDYLVPALADGSVVEISLDGARGYGSSFLEEAFGGLVRLGIVPNNDIHERIVLVGSDDVVISEIRKYISDAISVESGDV